MFLSRLSRRWFDDFIWKRTMIIRRCGDVQQLVVVVKEATFNFQFYSFFFYLFSFIIYVLCFFVCLWRRQMSRVILSVFVCIVIWCFFFLFFSSLLTLLLIIIIHSNSNIILFFCIFSIFSRFCCMLFFKKGAVGHWGYVWMALYMCLMGERVGGEGFCLLGGGVEDVCSWCLCVNVCSLIGNSRVFFV